MLSIGFGLILYHVLVLNFSRLTPQELISHGKQELLVVVEKLQ